MKTLKHSVTETGMKINSYILRVNAIESKKFCLVLTA